MSCLYRLYLSLLSTLVAFSFFFFSFSFGASFCPCARNDPPLERFHAMRHS